MVPRRREDVIHRQRLIDLLHAHIQLRVQVVSAPAGYGKTTLLMDFGNDLDVPVCWYSLDTSDKDPRLLLEGILASIRSRFPDFGQLTQSRLLVTEDVAKEVEHLVGTLTGEIYVAIPEYFVLVLEDYHFVEDSNLIKRLLDLFLNRAPDNCHIIISSRISVELPAISKLVSQRQAVSLDASDLAFTAVEVKELLATYYSLSLSDAAVDKLVTDMEGWILGVLLNIYSLQAGGLCRATPVLTQRDLFRYLAAEVYEKQPFAIQSFLLASSILDELEPDFCDRLLGLANSRKLLHDIERRNLFTNRIDGEKTWYRYHHLFREFLQTKLLEENPEQFTLLHCQAASLFEQDQRWNEAVTHFLSARKYDEAIRVIKIVGEDFHKSGKWTTVARWIDALPGNMRLSDPALVVLYAQSLIREGKADEAIHILTSLLSQVTSKENWLYEAKALSWRSAAFRLTGYFAEAMGDIRASIRLLERHGGPSDILGEAHMRLGNIHAEQGRFRLALRYLQRALKYYSPVFDVGQMAAVHNSLGIIYKRLGDLTKANMHFEHARQGWQKVRNYGSLAMTLNNMGNIYRRQGQYDLALDTFRSGLERARETKYRRAEALILINMAEVLRDSDLYDDALAMYHQGLELAREVMEAYYVALATAGIGETHRLLGARDKAEVLLKEAISQAKEHGQTYEATLFATQLGIIEYERGRYERAVAILSNACKRFSEIGDKDALAKAYFHLAQVSFLSKEYDVAISWLEKVSSLADELGYEDFLVVEGRNSVLLIQYGASKGVGGNRLVRIMEELRKRRDGKRKESTTEISVRPYVPVKPDIEAHALGESRVLVDSRLVSEGEWRSNRAKEIYFYLLCCATGRTKEQIATALWPDLSPAKCTSNFHINLYRARRAVFPGIFTLEQGHYKLNPDLNIWSDVAEFESLLSQAEKLPPASKARAANLEQAIELYKGPFMDEFYSEWTEMPRRELEDKYLKALSLSASSYADKGEYDKAITLLEKSVAVDPYQDEVYCQIIEWQLTVGDRARALRTYKHYVDITAGEIAIAPSARMQKLLKRILVGEETA
ncbi:MAG: tetratricopeptide repeat protein [Chloroflexi bacterium]|nr:tetratricopeptide repeat protein [Chloroflexota bacterium]